MVAMNLLESCGSGAAPSVRNDGKPSWEKRAASLISCSRFLMASMSRRSGRTGRTPFASIVS